MAIQFHPLPAELFPASLQPYIKRHNVELREIFGLEGTIRQPLTSRKSDLSVTRRGDVQVDVSRITPSITQIVSGQSTVVSTPALTFGLVNVVGSTTTAISINSTLALFGTGLPSPLASSASAGSSAFAARADHAHLFGPTLQSTLSSSTLTLTDDASNQTLTGSLGIIKLVSASNQVQLDYWTGAGGSTPIVGTVLSFNANTGVVPNTLRNGLEATLTIQDASTYTGAVFIAVRGQVSSGLVAGQTFTTCTAQAGVFRIPSVTYSAGTHTFTEKSALDLVISPGLRSGAGAVDVTDCYGLRISGWPTVGTGGTYTNARSCRVLFPTVGSTIRRGFSLETGTQNIGTESANTEGYYCEDLTRGTARRVAFYNEGATTGTPTGVYGTRIESHGVGTDRWSHWGSNKYECDASDFIAETSGKGIIVKASDDTTRYLRIRALYNAGVPSLTIDDVGTAKPTT